MVFDDCDDKDEVRQAVKSKWSKIRANIVAQNTHKIFDNKNLKFYCLSCQDLFYRELFDFELLACDLIQSIRAEKVASLMMAFNIKSVLVLKIKHDLLSNYIETWALTGAILEKMSFNKDVDLAIYKSKKVWLIYNVFGVPLINREEDEQLRSLFQVEEDYNFSNLVADGMNLEKSMKKLAKSEIESIKRSRAHLIRELTEFFQKALTSCSTQAFASTALNSQQP